MSSQTADAHINDFIGDSNIVVKIYSPCNFDYADVHATILKNTVSLILMNYYHLNLKALNGITVTLQGHNEGYLKTGAVSSMPEISLDPAVIVQYIYNYTAPSIKRIVTSISENVNDVFKANPKYTA